MAGSTEMDITVRESVISGPTRPIPVQQTSQGKAVVKKAADILGWSFVETTGVNGARVDIYDGIDNTGTLIAVVQLNASESVIVYLSDQGIHCLVGIYLDVKNGSVEGSVWTRL